MRLCILLNKAKEDVLCCIVPSFSEDGPQMGFLGEGWGQEATSLWVT
jgi:hypothetical protein